MLPDGAHITHEQSAPNEDGIIEHLWGIELAGDRIALLSVCHLPSGANVTDSIEAGEGWQRRGLGTALIEAARELLGEVQHSEWLTADGLGPGEALGGRRHGRPQDWTTVLSDGTRILGPTYTDELSLEGSH